MIQRTVCESIQNLLRDPKPDFSINDIINSSLNDKTKMALIEYCQDETVHSVHLITYEELLSYVWNRIIKSAFKEQLMRILEEQIEDSICKCFTGRFNRTLSVLVGYYDDIKINISDNSRISAIILNCKEKIVPYDLEKHKQKATDELLDAGYMESEIRTWIEAIDE
jgi:redox-regulated HSP33 family molecular chaperone